MQDQRSASGSSRLSGGRPCPRSDWVSLPTRSQASPPPRPGHASSSCSSEHCRQFTLISRWFVKVKLTPATQIDSVLSKKVVCVGGIGFLTPVFCLPARKQPRGPAPAGFAEALWRRRRGGRIPIASSPPVIQAHRQLCQLAMPKHGHTGSQLHHDWPICNRINPLTQSC